MGFKKGWLILRRGYQIPFICAVYMLSSCSTTVERTLVTPDFHLNISKTIFARLATSTGAISVNTANLANINKSGSGAVLAGASSTQLLPGEKQAILAFESLQFELMAMGFTLVDKEDKADYLVDFSIGSVRNDPISGWIADQAFVKFLSATDNKLLAFYRARLQFITPTINNIIKNLASSIKSDLSK